MPRGQRLHGYEDLERSKMPQHIENKTSIKVAGIPFKKIKDAALGQGYELSLVFVTSKISHEINNKYRGKDKSTNILSFPYSKDDGEILMDLNLIKEEARSQNENFKTYITYLFIHGLIHLKGFDHGSRMEGEEKKIREKFKTLFSSSELF